MKVTTPIKVRYQETDQMGVVYHANYLIWFEIGRTDFIEKLGFRYHEMEAEGIVSPVVDANIQFKHPIRYGDDAYVETWLEKYNGIRTTYGYRIINQDGQEAVTGETQHVIVRKENFRPLSLKKQFPNWHEAYQKALESAE
ncbi:acyl-CoA thioesterase [Gracilibacillus sp. HCP3S3_G5_1]|uniref:acyl-CoA thioesterase n=1 Tax=unclassified Gracilibacillus TaxID=2625209 RepID=UPI003F89FCCD